MKRRIAVIAVLGTLFVLSAAMAADVAAPPAEGSAVEVREGDSWSAATFVRKEGRRLLIRYDEGGVEEWITADRMRVAQGAAAKTSPAGAAAAEAVTLEGPFIEIAMDNAPAPRRVGAALVKQTPTTRPSTPFTSITLAEGGALPEISEFLPCADTPDILIGVSQGHDKQCQLVRIDLQHPDKAELRTLAAPEQEVQSAADDGRLILTKPRGGNAVTLHLWEYVGDEYKLKANYTLTSKKGGKKVEWATLVTPTRVALESDWGETYLIDLKTHRAISFFQHHGYKPTFHPTGRLLQVANNGPAILRASDFGIVAELANTSPFHNVSVDPGGTVAACVAGNVVQVVKLGTGTVVSNIAASIRENDKIHLLSPETILVGDVVYDVKTGIPVWEYATPPNTKVQLLPSGQVLYAIPQNGSTVACMVTIPEPQALETLKAQRPDDYLLARGAQIALVGNLNMYGSEEKAAQEIVRKMITSAGHKLATGASRYKLTFTSAVGPTEELRYSEHMYMGPPVARKVSAPSTIVTATLTRDEQAIWQQTWKYCAGGVLMRQGGQSMEQAAAAAATPNVQSLNSMSLPGYLPKGSTPGNPAALGASSITPEGFGPSVKPAPPAPPKEPPVVRATTT